MAWSKVMGRIFWVCGWRSLRTARPRTGQRRHPEDAARRRARKFDRFQRRTARQREAGLYGHQDVVGREVEILLGGEQTLVQLGDALLQLSFSAHEVFGAGNPGLGEASVQVLQGAFNKAGHLRRDDRIDTAHVGAHRVQFPQGAKDVLAEAADRCAVRAATIDRVPDQHFLLALAVAVDTPVTLLHHVGVVGNLQVDEPIAVVLQVDAFGGRVGGEQDAHGRILRRSLERRFDGFAFFLR